MIKPVSVGVVMDSITKIKPYKDSSFAMMLAAQAREWPIFYFEQDDLFIKDGVAWCKWQQLELTDTKDNWFRFIDKGVSPLHERVDVVLMRKDPPFNMEYIYTTYILELAEQLGVLMVNKPQSLRDANEKLFTTHFPQCCTTTLVSRSMEHLREFVAEHQDVIFKPLDQMGGASIYRVQPDDQNVSVILETLTAMGTQCTMAQKFIPDISQGDKRILIVDGVPVPYALARIPKDGETRGNLAAGGRAEGVPLTTRDLWICEQVSQTLKDKGLIFVGLDVIGDYLTEINITSPTCIRELDSLYSLDIGGQLMDAIEQRLGADA